VFHAKVKKECLVCGESFENIKHTKFCSNNCKSAHRRKLGVDNVDRKCAQCGCIFSVNKYKKVKFCSRKCSANARRKIY
jgi:endogenous inhibitor of DNA gyrase (YacG/DUF329 family)